ncbi:Na+/H+ antiporter subunit E [Microbacterium sp. VKM Ac-2923]|uniref:Na+/H+ antiporter subunit E n=1 Tax=Microbacterium sp. VKM Ac-2923 TaxID=2929476 RepID=UPI001FB41F2C|nr:Na+/H+ antiporter subunit E [Microbacterium sp. VKM Ac-2923]MCJ1708362.1 Na+/H+ antiporter subunit E [Microbacterium sp. VKM Ac-2923]
MIASLLVRLCAVALLWLAATEAAASALVYGLATVPVVVAVTYVLLPRRRTARRGDHRGLAGRRVRGILIILGIAGWVLWRSVVGGVDVARRALHLPRADIDPRWSEYETRLRSGPARVALALVMNLMPGSLSARLDGARLEVHVIDPSLDVHSSIAALEERLARVEEAFA